MNSQLRPLLISTLLSSSLLLGCGSDSTPPAATPTNQSPAVTVSGESTIQEGQVITLTANASDADGSITSVKWSTASTDITLSGDDTTSVSFTAPDVDNDDISVTLDVLVTDNDGATATQSITITITRKVSSVTITGLVIDNIASNADVEITIGTDAFSTTTDENGVYAVTITVDESLEDNLLQIRALGDSSINPEVELVSQLGSLTSLIEQAGSDGDLTEDENFGVNITKVTTAEYALLSRDGVNPTNDAELNTALNLIQSQEKNTLAALIKIITDNDDFSLPSGVTSTLNLVSDSANAAAFEQDVITQDPNLINKTIAAIVNDNSLTSESDIVGSWKAGTDIITFMRSGHYAHISTEIDSENEDECGQIGYEVGTYVWDSATGSMSVTTKEDSGGCGGLHDDQPLNTAFVVESLFTVTGSGDMLTVQEGDEIFNLPRLVSDSNPLVGGFYLKKTNFSDDLSMLFTVDDNTIVLLSSGNGLPEGISYFYVMRDYSYDAESSLRVIHSQKVYIDGDVVQETTEEVGRALITVQGDVVASHTGGSTAFIKNSQTTTTQDYLNAEDVIGDFDGVNGEDNFNITINADGTALANGEVVLQWEVTFGQLLLISESFTQIWSPTTLANDTWQFNINEYTAEGDFDRSNVGSLTKSN
ncbi:MAG: hypothetical protein ABJK37_23225 [Paraglaciecola sp.]|uniref:PKD domain-containing protein n=1 Tax=Paraglaciecola sp. TaxID=1920173 RepID=UPI0032969015